MKAKKLTLPAILILLAVAAMILTSVLTGITLKPTVTQADFPFSVTYEYNGEEITVEKVYSCNFGYSQSQAGYQYRYWEGQLLDNDGYNSILIAEVIGGKLEIITNLYEGYLMGDPLDADYYEENGAYEPYVAFYDEMGVEYSGEDMPSEHNVKIVDWDYPEPIENEFVYSHMTPLSSGMVIPLMLIAVLCLLLCLIFVRKDKEHKYNAVDTVGVVLSFLILFIPLPFMTVYYSLVDLVGGGEGLFYQIQYCIPAATVMLVAASLCLRRKGFRKSGLAVQLAGPIAFGVMLVLETILSFAA